MSLTERVVEILRKGDFEARDGDWEARNDALIELQQLFRTAAATVADDEAEKTEEARETPREADHHVAFDLEAWRALRLPLTGALRDLRSHLVREACALVARVWPSHIVEHTT
mmetsp:Transcript_3922/g.15627  ORF Transcript_3922/g.15627 Transcript_3922/m.15627 type:complete len:113 (-) Transcript_3922:2197-2535(-)